MGKARRAASRGAAPSDCAPARRQYPRLLGGFEQAIDQALWDLHGKLLGLPLWKLLGGRDRKVRLYASGLDFHLSDKGFEALFGAAQTAGYRGFKIKVGHPDIAWDLHRLALIKEIAAGSGPIMIDANEAWSPKEATRRLKVYLREGHEVLWIEDPVSGMIP